MPDLETVGPCFLSTTGSSPCFLTLLPESIYVPIRGTCIPELPDLDWRRACPHPRNHFQPLHHHAPWKPNFRVENVDLWLAPDPGQAAHSIERPCESVCVPVQVSAPADPILGPVGSQGEIPPSRRKSKLHLLRSTATGLRSPARDSNPKRASNGIEPPLKKGQTPRQFSARTMSNLGTWLRHRSPDVRVASFPSCGG